MCLHPPRHVMARPSPGASAFSGLHRARQRRQTLVEFDRLGATGIKPLIDLMDMLRTERQSTLIAGVLC